MLTVTNEDVLPAYLQRVSDFEDCLLATCTKANQCDAIVTRNKKDFLSFWITLLSPEELLNISFVKYVFTIGSRRKVE